MVSGHTWNSSELNCMQSADMPTMTKGRKAGKKRRLEIFCQGWWTMNTKGNMATKAAAILIMLVGLFAMLVAWDLMLVAEFYTKTVFLLEMGGVALTLAGYFLWRRARGAKLQSQMQPLCSDKIE